MNLNQNLYQKSAGYLSAFFILALLAFWSSYFAVLGRPMAFYIHLHGLFMTAWCLILIAQAFLIRAKQYSIHTIVRKASYLIFPVLILSTILLIHATVRKSPEVNFGTYFSMALMINATVVLSVIYALGIFFRKERLTHARYMICTVFPLSTPITDRIIYKYIPGLVDLAPRIQGVPAVPFYGFLLADLVVIGLAVWDWKVHRRKDVFLIVLVLLLVYHVSLFTTYKMPAWHSFSKWFYHLGLT